MKTLKKSNLEELAKIMPVLSEGIQRMCIGGLAGDSGEIPPVSGGTDGGWTPPPPIQGALGSIDNPYSFSEAEGLMDAGFWRGGYVEGMGYVSPQVEVTAPSVNNPIPNPPIFPDSGFQGSGVTGVTGVSSGGSSKAPGGIENPYSYGTALMLKSAGLWYGGYVEGYGYVDSGGYLGQIGNNVGTGGGGGGSSESNPHVYQGSYVTGSTCLPDDLTARWGFIKYTLYDMAGQLGVDLYKYSISDSIGRGAYAWTSSDGKIHVGNSFFGMSSDCDRVATLIHESIHVDRRDNEKYQKETAIEDFLFSDNPPSFVKEYVQIQHEKDTKANANIDLDIYMKLYCSCDVLKTPSYYENEIATYTQERQIVPDSYVSSEYSLERQYKLWKYELLLEASKAYYK